MNPNILSLNIDDLIFRVLFILSLLIPIFELVHWLLFRFIVGVLLFLSFVFEHLVGLDFFIPLDEVLKLLFTLILLIGLSVIVNFEMDFGHKIIDEGLIENMVLFSQDRLFTFHHISLLRDIIFPFVLSSI